MNENTTRRSGPRIKTSRKRKWIETREQKREQNGGKAQRSTAARRRSVSASASTINHKSLFYEYSDRENNVGCARSIGISFLPPSLCRRFKLALCKCNPRVYLPFAHFLILYPCVFRGRVRIPNFPRSWWTNEQWCRHAASCPIFVLFSELVSQSR